MLFCFFSLLFGPLLLSNLIFFYILFILNCLKFYKSITWSFTNHLWTLITTQQHKKIFFECSEIGFGNVWWFVFLSSEPSWVVTFSFLIYFQRLLVCHMRQKEGFKFCLDTRNNRAVPLDPAWPEHLNVQSPASLPLHVVNK
jgi:hypothetical protein